MTENKRFEVVDSFDSENKSVKAIRDNETTEIYGMDNELEANSTCVKLNALHEENNQLKSDLAKVIEQARKNDNLLRSDIRILEKALWCSGCENDFKRLKELRKEFIR